MSSGQESALNTTMDDLWPSQEETKMKSTNTICIYEDNAGQIHLFELDSACTPIYQLTYPEINDQLRKDIASLADTDPAEDWEGNEVEEDPGLYEIANNWSWSHPGTFKDITDDLIG